MSSISAALQYKLHKMQQQMEALTEENYRLRSILSEANIAAMSQPEAYNYGGGVVLGQNLAMQPNVGVAGMASAAKGMSPTSTSAPGGPGAMAKPTMPLGSRGMGSVAQGAPATTNMTPAARSLAVQASGAMNTGGPVMGGPVTPPTGGFDGGYHGYLLATDPRAAAAYVAQFQAPSVTGMRTGTSMPSVTSTTQRRR
jgi:hypothetical protein